MSKDFEKRIDSVLSTLDDTRRTFLRKLLVGGCIAVPLISSIGLVEGYCQGEGPDWGKGKGEGPDWGKGKGEGPDWGKGKGEGPDWGKGKGEGPPPQQGGFEAQPVITADQATAAASAAITKLTLGKLYTKPGAQEVLLEAPLQLDGSIVGRVRLNPSNGEILAEGQAAMAQQVSVNLEEAGKSLRAILPEIHVGGGAWLGREGQWKVPLVYQRVVISELGVNSKDAAILPDWGASRDVSLYGK